MAYIITDSCVACGTCITECPVGAIIEGDNYKIDDDICVSCGTCVFSCPTGAIVEHVVKSECSNKKEQVLSEATISRLPQIKTQLVGIMEELKTIFKKKDSSVDDDIDRTDLDYSLSSLESAIDNLEFCIDDLDEII